MYQIDKIRDAYTLCELARKVNSPVYLKRGSVTVSGQSLFGLFAIDPSTPFDIEFENEESMVLDDNVKEFMDFIDKFTV